MAQASSGAEAIRAVRKRLAKGLEHFDVEHFTPLASRCTAQDVDAIEELALEQGWATRREGRFAPAASWNGSPIPMAAIFGRWTIVICIYLRLGLDGLVDLACAPPASLTSLRTFAVDLLDALGSADAVEAATRIIRFHLGSLARPRRAGTGGERETLVMAMEKVGHSLLVPKRGVVLSEEAERTLREVLHDVLAAPGLDERELDAACNALCWVGDPTSVDRIAKLPLPPDLAGLVKDVRREVRKRSRAGPRKAAPAASTAAEPRLFEHRDIDLVVLRSERRADGWLLRAGSPPDPRFTPVELAIERRGDTVVLRSTGEPSDGFLCALAGAYETPLKPGARMAAQSTFTCVALPGSSTPDVAQLKLFHEARPYCEVFLNVNLTAGEVQLLEKDGVYRGPLLKVLTQRKPRARP